MFQFTLVAQGDDLYGILYMGEVTSENATCPFPVSGSCDSCYATHNKATLRDLIAATGLIILFKLDSYHRFLQSHWWIQTGVTVRVKIGDFSSHVTLKFDGWPWKTIGHLSYTTSSFVHHFKAIGGVGGAVRFLVVGTIGQRGRPPRVSSGWSSVWHRSNTGLSSTQYEQIPIILGVWPFWLTPFFFRSITFWRAYG